MADQPNPIRVAWSIFRAQRKRRPAPGGNNEVDHGGFAPILERLRTDGVAALADVRSELNAYRSFLEAVHPDTLTRDGAKAYWLNLYNAGALDLAAETAAVDAASVLRVPGGFSRPWATVAGEALSLDAIEHGKIRRFGDPRIHGALVCGSASCPTLRFEPYRGADVDRQLGDQMRTFLAAGGAVPDRAAGVLRLSRIFLWYGGDFTRPHRMPTWLPARKPMLADALGRWLSDDVVAWVATTGPRVEFLRYDWGLACSVA
jgi:hypothetical protein